MLNGNSCGFFTCSLKSEIFFSRIIVEGFREHYVICARQVVRRGSLHDPGARLSTPPGHAVRDRLASEEQGFAR
jgi:hypothetical protein